MTDIVYVLVDITILSAEDPSTESLAGIHEVMAHWKVHNWIVDQDEPNKVSARIAKPGVC